MAQSNKRNIHYDYCPKERAITKLEEQMTKIKHILEDNGQIGLVTIVNRMDTKIALIMEGLSRVPELNDSVNRLMTYKTELEAQRKVVIEEDKKKVERERLLLERERNTLQKEYQLKIDKSVKNNNIKWAIILIITIILSILGWLI